jgi:hypothetical protein
MITKLDWNVISAAIQLWQKDPAIREAPRAFVAVAIDTVLGLAGNELISCITDGGGDRGVDAVVIDEGMAGTVVHIFQCKLHGDFKARTNNFPASEIDKTLSFLTDLFDESILSDSKCNPILIDKCREIIALMQSSAVVPIRIHYCSTGGKLTPEDRARLLNSIQTYDYIDLIEHDCVDFAERLSTSRRVQKKKKLRFDGDVVVRKDGSIRALAGTVTARHLTELMAESANSAAIDRSIFEENVRLFLGPKNDVNQQIVKTASSTFKPEFWYLNNGITIVCDRFEWQSGKPKGIAELHQPQIVNGGQTSHALFELGSIFREQLDGVSVFVRVIETTDRELRQRIAIATNSQTSIRGRDLRSNDLLQVKIERALRRRGFFYERKRDQFSSKPIATRVDALRTGQAILAYYKREPDKAKTQSDKIFGDLYSFIFDPDWIDDDKIVTVVRLLRDVEARRDLALQTMRSRLTKDYAEHWLVEGLFHVLFMMGELSLRAGKDLSNYDEVSTSLNEAVRLVGEFYGHANAAAYRVFRSVQTKDKLIRFERARQLPLDLEGSSR